MKSIIVVFALLLCATGAVSAKQATVVQPSLTGPCQSQAEDYALKALYAKAGSQGAPNNIEVHAGVKYKYISDKELAYKFQGAIGASVYDVIVHIDNVCKQKGQVELKAKDFSTPVPDTQPPSDNSEVIAQNADPDLLLCVQELEQSGATGIWFSEISPFDPEQSTRYSFYLLTGLPASVDIKAKLFLLRLAHTQKYLEQLLASGVPIVLGVLPVETQKMAAAIGDNVPLGASALAAGSIQNHHNIILIQPETRKLELAHEYRHWQDFEDIQFKKNFVTDMTPFFSAKYLNDAAKQFLFNMIWEIRGHNAQIAQARSDAENRMPYLEPDGRPGQESTLGGDYKFEENFLSSNFFQAHSGNISIIMAKIKANEPAGVGEIVRIFSTYELNPKGGKGISLKNYANK